MIDSRHSEDGIRRRRECLVCKHRFSTCEIDVDHYETLKHNDREAIYKEFCDGCENIAKKLFKALHIKVEEEKEK